MFEPTSAERTRGGRELGRMKGRPVIDSAGDNVGTVADLVIEPATWRVSGFVVNLRRDLADRLGLRRGNILEAPRIEIGSERVKAVGDNVILNIDAATMADTLHREPLPLPPNGRGPGGAFDEVPPSGPSWDRPGP